MNKVYINGRFLTQSITGVQRFAHEVLKELDKIADQNEGECEFIIITPKNIVQQVKFKNIKVFCKGFLKGHLWEQFELPFFTRGHLLLNLCNVGPMFKKNQIVTIHDASVFLENNDFSFLFRTWYRILMKLEAKNAKSIITVSQFSCDEIQKYIVPNKSKIKVIYEGNEHIKNRKADYNVLQKYSLTNQPYILAVSSLDPRKNFKNIVRAIEKLHVKNINVVIAGGTNPRVFNSKDAVFPPNVKYLGYVSDEELKALYECAYCFIYPSFYEGFGLPPLEAMTTGCPVIVSDQASLPEIFREAALYCNPSDPNDIMNKIKFFLNHPEARDEYKQKGIKRAAKFSWHTSANELWTILRTL